MEIAYTIEDSPLGRMLVAATRRGVCAVCFGDEDEKLEEGLRAEFPAAKIGGGGTEDRQAAAALAREVAAALLETLHGARPNLDLPLDVQGTAFQLRVWAELRRIPAGQTRSYTQVAQALGQPRAVRAVANACGANPTAVITPCHRVVRSDGSLGGYQWGVERKKKLLESESH